MTKGCSPSGLWQDGELNDALRSYVPHSDQEKRLVRKIDLFLMPMLCLTYVLNYVDRTNIGNAKIAGMQHDLALSDDAYAWVLSIFFFGYLICEVPSNMILSRSKPSVFLPSIMLVWGVVSALMSVSRNYASLLAFRFVLGCLESGFFPGVLYLLSCWYTKEELGKRFAIFYTSAVLSGAFGGLLAGGITSGLKNTHGIPGWRWLFIVEGVATVGVAIVAYFVLLDYPATSKRLTPAERRLAAVRIIHDGIAQRRGPLGEGRQSQEQDQNRQPNDEEQLEPPSHWQAFKAAISDARTYIFVLLFMCIVGAGTISYFIPAITLSLGYDTITAQYMTVPIYAVASTCLNIAAWSSDRHVERRWHTTGSLAVGFICSLICMAVRTPVVRYVMVCFVAAGIWSSLPLVLSWTSGVIALPPEKRAIVLAIVNAFGNLASVYGSRIWPSTDAPAYRLGFAVTAGFLGTGMVLAALVPPLCGLLNRWTASAGKRPVAGVEDQGQDSP